MAKQDYITNFEEWKKDFSFYHQLTVRFGEIDGFGHVNNTNMFVYMEEARIALFKELGLMETWRSHQSDEIIVAADLQCDFMAQILFDETLRIFVKIHRVGSSSIDLHYLALNEKDVAVFTGRGSIVQISKQTGKSSAWSDSQLKLFTKYTTNR